MKYQGTGASETTIGNKNLGSEFIIVTKAPTGFGGGAGKRENILKEGRKSNEVLKVDKVRTSSPPIQAYFSLTVRRFQFISYTLQTNQFQLQKLWVQSKHSTKKSVLKRFPSPTLLVQKPS